MWHTLKYILQNAVQLHDSIVFWRELGTSKELGRQALWLMLPSFQPCGRPRVGRMVIGLGWLLSAVSHPGLLTLKLQGCTHLYPMVDWYASSSSRSSQMCFPWRDFPCSQSPTAIWSPQPGPTKLGVTVTKMLQRLDHVVRKSEYS